MILEHPVINWTLGEHKREQAAMRPHCKQAEVCAPTLQVGEGRVEDMGDGIFCAPVGPVGKLQGVEGGGKHGAYESFNQALKALAHNGSEGYGAPVVQTGHLLLLGNGNDGAGFETGGDRADGK